MKNVVLFIFIFLSACINESEKYDKKQDAYTQSVCCEGIDKKIMIKELSLVNGELFLEVCDLNNNSRLKIEVVKLEKSFNAEKIISKIVSVKEPYFKIGKLENDGSYRLHIQYLETSFCGDIKFKVDSLKLKLIEMLCLEYCS